MSLLYEARIKDTSPSELLHSLQIEESDFVRERLVGIELHRPEIEELIRSHSRGWSIDRMPLLDLCILWLALYELLYQPDAIPTPVAISEAVELAKNFSTSESGKFINGILSAIAKEMGRIPAPEVTTVPPDPG